MITVYAEAERKRADEQSSTGRKHLAKIHVPRRKAMIVTRLRNDESNPMTDYFSSKSVSTVIGGFSYQHARPILPRYAYAANMPETAYLSEINR